VTPDSKNNNQINKILINNYDKNIVTKVKPNPTTIDLDKDKNDIVSQVTEFK